MQASYSAYILPKKEIVGKRLAYQALNKAYNYENIPCDGPVMSDIEIKEDKLIVSFKNAEHGLYPMFVELEGFEVAGEDKKNSSRQKL